MLAWVDGENLWRMQIRLGMWSIFSLTDYMICSVMYLPAYERGSGKIALDHTYKLHANVTGS